MKQNMADSANVPRSNNGLPKKGPKRGESIQSYRERIYNLYQDQVRKKENGIGKEQILGFGEWKEIFGSEVDANWDLRKNKESLNTNSPKTANRKKRKRKIGGLSRIQLVILVVVLASIVPLEIMFPSDDETKVEEIKKQSVITMPKAIGMNYGEFVEKENKFVEKFYPDTIDLIDSRSIWDDYNWVIVAQIPPAGSKVLPDDRICLGVVKVEESNLDHKRLHCWQEIREFENTAGYSFDMLDNGLLQVKLPQPELKGFFLKAEVLIEMKDWSTVTITYCSYEAVGTNGTATINLKLDPGPGGIESFDVELFNDWTGAYTYRIKQMWKSFGAGCFSF
jgi:hypothetical protein